MLIVPLVQGRELGWAAWMWVLMFGSLVVLATFFTALAGFTPAFNLLMQLDLGWTPLHSGLSLIPWAIGTAVGAGLAGAVLADRLGRATLHLGFGIAGGLAARGVGELRGSRPWKSAGCVPAPTSAPPRWRWSTAFPSSSDSDQVRAGYPAEVEVVTVVVRGEGELLAGAVLVDEGVFASAMASSNAATVTASTVPVAGTSSLI
jgi:hypothetical protein